MESINGKTNQWKKALRLGQDFISLFFPNYCMGCSRALVRGEDILCTFCIHDLPKAAYDFSGDNPVRNRFAGRLTVTRASAYLRFRKTGLVQKLLHQLKYHHHPEIGVKLGALMGLELVRPVAHELDIIIPVPLHISRQRQRGYNQSAKIAEGISKATGIPWMENISIRKGKTKTQTKMTRSERWENVKDEFGITNIANVAGKKILLVDDVMTTGATLEACGQHLLTGGCAALNILCIAEA